MPMTVNDEKGARLPTQTADRTRAGDTIVARPGRFQHITHRRDPRANLHVPYVPLPGTLACHGCPEADLAAMGCL